MQRNPAALLQPLPTLASAQAAPSVSGLEVSVFGRPGQPDQQGRTDLAVTRGKQAETLTFKPRECSKSRLPSSDGNGCSPKLNASITSIIVHLPTPLPLNFLS